MSYKLKIHRQLLDLCSLLKIKLQYSLPSGTRQADYNDLLLYKASVLLNEGKDVNIYDLLACVHELKITLFNLSQRNTATKSDYDNSQLLHKTNCVINKVNQYIKEGKL